MEENKFLDKEMKEVFDWSDSTIPVRVATWNHFMKANGADTMKTESDVHPLFEKPESELKPELETLLKA